MPPVHRRLTVAERVIADTFARQAVETYPDVQASQQFLAASQAASRADIAYTWASLAACFVHRRGWGTWKQVAILEAGAIEAKAGA